MKRRIDISLMFLTIVILIVGYIKQYVDNISEFNILQEIPNSRLLVQIVLGIIFIVLLEIILLHLTTQITRRSKSIIVHKLYSIDKQLYSYLFSSFIMQSFIQTIISVLIYKYFLNVETINTIIFICFPFIIYIIFSLIVFSRIKNTSILEYMKKID